MTPEKKPSLFSTSLLDVLEYEVALVVFTLSPGLVSASVVAMLGYDASCLNFLLLRGVELIHPVSYTTESLLIEAAMDSNLLFITCVCNQCSMKRRDRVEPSFIVTKAGSRVAAALHRAMTRRRDGTWGRI